VIKVTSKFKNIFKGIIGTSLEGKSLEEELQIKFNLKKQFFSFKSALRGMTDLF
jgi:hypothetical protein